MAKYMHNHFNHRPIQNTSWNQHNMWRQRHNLHNRHFTRPVWTSPLLEFDYKYWCETCDKGFRTPAHLAYHRRLHQKCNIDGCQFVAHPKVITKHIQMQHATGLFKKIGRLNNPEEIQRWREERKKKYPTKENIEKKQAQMKEKIKRGEKMGMARERNMKNINKDMQKNRKNHLSNRKNVGPLFNRKRTLPEIIKKATLTNKICKIIPPMEDNRKLKPFTGIQDLLNEDNIEEDIQDIQSNDLIEDEEQIGPVEKGKQSEPALCGALTSLICNYGSSDEDEPEEKTNETCEITDKISDKNKREVEEKGNTLKPNSGVFKIFVKPIEQLIDQNKTSQDNMTDISKTDHNEIEDDSGPEESRIVKENISANNVQTSNNKTRKERSGSANKQRLTRNLVKLRKKLPSTLLEKLLHKEIQHERNIILQCVRYVIQKKYFNEDPEIAF